jgi:hypothetical protein
MGKVHELLKDPMLEKLVLLVVSLFSMATETRLEAEKNKHSEDFIMSPRIA